MVEEVPVKIASDEEWSGFNIVLLIIAIFIILKLFVLTGCNCTPECSCASALWCGCGGSESYGVAASAESFGVASDVKSVASIPAADKPSIYYHYTTWCGYCKKMKPIWAEVAAEMSGIAFFHALDEDVEHTADITSYPTIMAHIGDKKVKYDGGYTKEALVKFVKDTVSMKAGGY